MLVGFGLSEREREVEVVGFGWIREDLSRRRKDGVWLGGLDDGR